MQVGFAVTEATTGEEWIELESCWSRILVSVPVPSIQAKIDRMAELFALLCRYLDGITAEHASALCAARYDGSELTVYWEDRAARESCSERLLVHVRSLGGDVRVHHRHGSPLETSRTLAGGELLQADQLSILAA